MERCNCRKRGRAKQGFTLAELLIVVAIIAVLAAISIPIFNSQLAKARQATNAANLRSAYAEASSVYILGDATGTTATINSEKTEVTIKDVLLTSDGIGDDKDVTVAFDLSGANWGNTNQTKPVPTKVVFHWTKTTSTTGGDGTTTETTETKPNVTFTVGDNT
ncbi:MAG: type II secretion system protein [Lachnospiraceae bacterium]|nr:type II secretion system protein [Lachnospiraceae bacterium]